MMNVANFEVPGRNDPEINKNPEGYRGFSRFSFLACRLAAVFS